MIDRILFWVECVTGYSLDFMRPWPYVVPLAENDYVVNCAVSR